MLLDEIDLFCKMFIDTDAGYEEVAQYVSESIDGKRGRWVISSPCCAIYLRGNDEFDESKRLEHPCGFLFSRYYLDIEPNEGIDSYFYIACISKLLVDLRDSGCRAVAACDFEQMLT
ncbi:1,4-dihydroxy-6-naphthoate synthase [Paenibacillus sp. MMS18-CY102]|uniref:1,4-dihydroxy-6-naphthoate synthase n=1 Tax=Paenibacillus sp. MMS18-CY102 TaxID=2682849 RepID=UPI001365D6B4|nr:1,4-dihydroxy-6-naphthoate synthase [Paenibacillus sp. MMS18-CY102]MWC27340.1 1,4-dihydroxy-6-naphthoate synthase [Paenibacillus sp. MMS18-CY102]